LQPLSLKPLLQHVIETAVSLHASNIITVVGHGAEQVQANMAGPNVEFVLQQPQLGTGHAVIQAIPSIADNDTVLVLYGDVPLTSQATLEDLLSLVDDRPD